MALCCRKSDHCEVCAVQQPRLGLVHVLTGSGDWAPHWEPPGLRTNEPIALMNSSPGLANQTNIALEKSELSRGQRSSYS